MTVPTSCLPQRVFVIVNVFYNTAAKPSQLYDTKVTKKYEIYLEKHAGHSSGYQFVLTMRNP